MQGKRIRKRVGLVSVSVLMLLVTACSGSGGTPSTDSKGGGAAPAALKKGGKLIVGWSQPADTLDPAATINSSSSTIFGQIYATLVTRSKDGFEGNIAESWEGTPDAKTWTFSLRKELLFSNGDPVNADAVVFTFNRILDPKTKAPSRSFIGAVEKVEKVDEYTVKFTMLQPFALLLDSLANSYFGIVDPKAVAQFGADYGRNPVGSGPWKLKEWVTGDRLVLVPNDKYKGFHSFLKNKAQPFADELTFRDIPQLESQLAALESGEINFLAGLPGDKAAQMKGRPDVQLISPEASTSISYLSFGMTKAAAGQPNTFKAPFDDIRLRQAVGYAVDANQIIDKVLYGYGVRNATPMPTANFGYDPSLKQYGYDFNLQKANQLLDDAGWKMGTDNVREKGGKKLEVAFWALNGAGMGDVAQVVQSQLTKIGMKANITALDTATYTARVATGDMQLEMISVGWPAPNILSLITTFGWGTGLYNDQELAGLLGKAQSTADATQRKQLYGQAQQKMLQNASLIPLLSATTPSAVKGTVKDLVVRPDGAISFDEAYVTE